MRTYSIGRYNFVAGGAALEVDEATAEKLEGVTNKSEREAAAFEVSDRPFKAEPAASRSQGEPEGDGVARTARDERRASGAAKRQPAPPAPPSGEG